MRDTAVSTLYSSRPTAAALNTGHYQLQTCQALPGRGKMLVELSSRCLRACKQSFRGCTLWDDANNDRSVVSAKAASAVSELHRAIFFAAQPRLTGSFSGIRLVAHVPDDSPIPRGSTTPSSLWMAIFTR